MRFTSPARRTVDKSRVHTAPAGMERIAPSETYRRIRSSKLRARTRCDESFSAGSLFAKILLPRACSLRTRFDGADLRISNLGTTFPGLFCIQSKRVLMPTLWSAVGGAALLVAAAVAQLDVPGNERVQQVFSESLRSSGCQLSDP